MQKKKKSVDYDADKEYTNKDGQDGRPSIAVGIADLAHGAAGAARADLRVELKHIEQRAMDAEHGLAAARERIAALEKEVEAAKAPPMSPAGAPPSRSWQTGASRFA